MISEPRNGIDENVFANLLCYVFRYASFTGMINRILCRLSLIFLWMFCTELKFPSLFDWLKESLNRLSCPFVHEVDLLFALELLQWVEDSFSDDEPREPRYSRDHQIEHYLHGCGELETEQHDGKSCSPQAFQACCSFIQHRPTVYSTDTANSNVCLRYIMAWLLASHN